MEILKESEHSADTSSFPYLKFGFDKFNPVQTTALQIIDQDTNAVIASATGSGKTVIAEMYSAYELIERTGKVIYIAPMRALAKEKEDDWKNPNHPFSKYNIFICTGEYQLTNNRIKELDEADIIIMTPEMAAARIRNSSSEKSSFLYKVGTIIFDEAHLVGTTRGPHIEVALMKFSKMNPKTRFVLLSATLPNVEEFARWISNLNQKETKCLISEYRPIPLEYHYKPYDDYGSYWKKEESKINEAVKLVRQHHLDKFLIFAHTIRSGQEMLKALQQQNIKSAFYHSNLKTDEKRDLESRFKNPDGDIRVLVSTSSLAWGCFKEGTKITMGNGIDKKNIEDLIVEDEVFSFQIDRKNVYSTSKVLKIKPVQFDESLEISFVDNQTKNIEVSKDHLFCVYDYKNHYWVEASKLDKEKHLIGKHCYYKDYPNHNFNFKEIKSIEHKSGGTFYEIEVDNDHSYFGDDIASHNCNFPARRVIILGIHRGLELVDYFDLAQAAGRSGRLGFDTKGDCYFTLPKTKFVESKKHVLDKQNIQSQLLHDLPFHLVSEIHKGEVTNQQELRDWFERSFASFQQVKLRDGRILDCVNKLHKKGIIDIVDGTYKITSLGIVASMFYYDPFNCADLYYNFSNLFKSNKDPDDVQVAVALASLSSNYDLIMNTQEKELIMESDFFKKVRSEDLAPGILKIGFAYYNLLKGRELPELYALSNNLLQDSPRIIEILNAIDSLTAKWNRSEFFDELPLRLQYGVEKHLIPLCRIPNIKKARATKLWELNIRDYNDVLENKDKVKAITKLSNEQLKDVFDHCLTNMINV